MFHVNRTCERERVIQRFQSAHSAHIGLDSLSFTLPHPGLYRETGFDWFGSNLFGSFLFGKLPALGLLLRARTGKENFLGQFQELTMRVVSILSPVWIKMGHHRAKSTAFKLYRPTYFPSSWIMKQNLCFLLYKEEKYSIVYFHRGKLIRSAYFLFCCFVPSSSFFYGYIYKKKKKKIATGKRGKQKKIAIWDWWHTYIL